MHEDGQERILENEKLNKLKNIQAKGKLVSLFSDINDTNKFSSGFIAEISDKYVLLKHIDPHGLYDGYVTINYNDIFSIEYDGKYEKKLLDLYKYRKQSHQELDSLTGNVLYDVLLFSKKNNLIITIELLGSMLDNAQGFVNSVKNNIICIRKVDSFGNNDGNAIIQFEDITHIFCDTDDEMTLKILNSLYNK